MGDTTTAITKEVLGGKLRGRGILGEVEGGERNIGGIWTWGAASFQDQPCLAWLVDAAG
jgi:hypothetical protein